MYSTPAQMFAALSQPLWSLTVLCTPGQCCSSVTLRGGSISAPLGSESSESHGVTSAAAAQA